MLRDELKGKGHSFICADKQSLPRRPPTRSAVLRQMLAKSLQLERYTINSVIFAFRRLGQQGGSFGCLDDLTFSSIQSHLAFRLNPFCARGEVFNQSIRHMIVGVLRLAPSV